MCEWDIVTGYDEELFFGRGSHVGGFGEYARNLQSRPLDHAGLTGVTALIIKKGRGVFDKKAAEIAAIKEA